jgi:hypothetical protein
MYTLLQPVSCAITCNCCCTCCCCCCVCRCVAALAESSHPELEVLVLPDMLRSAMLSAVQVRVDSGKFCVLWLVAITET